MSGGGTGLTQTTNASAAPAWSWSLSSEEQGVAALGEARVAMRSLEMLVIGVFSPEDRVKVATRAVQRLQAAANHASAFAKWVESGVTAKATLAVAKVAPVAATPTKATATRAKRKKRAR